MPVDKLDALEHGDFVSDEMVEKLAKLYDQPTIRVYKAALGIQESSKRPEREVACEALEEIKYQIWRIENEG